MQRISATPLRGNPEPNFRCTFDITLPIIVGTGGVATQEAKDKWYAFKSEVDGMQVIPSRIYDDYFVEKAGGSYPVNNYVIPLSVTSLCPYLAKVGASVSNFERWRISQDITVKANLGPNLGAVRVIVGAFRGPETGGFVDLETSNIKGERTFTLTNKTGSNAGVISVCNKWLYNPLNLTESKRTTATTLQWDDEYYAGYLQFCMICDSPNAINGLIPDVGTLCGTIDLKMTIEAADVTTNKNSMAAFQAYVASRTNGSNSSNVAYTAGGSFTPADNNDGIQLFKRGPQEPPFPYVSVNKDYILRVPFGYNSKSGRHAKEIQRALALAVRRGLLTAKLADDPTTIYSFLEGYTTLTLGTLATVASDSPFINCLRPFPLTLAGYSDWFTEASTPEIASNYILARGMANGDVISLVQQIVQQGPVQKSGKSSRVLSVTEGQTATGRGYFGKVTYTDGSSDRQYFSFQRALCQADGVNAATVKAFADGYPVLGSFIISNIQGSPGEGAIQNAHLTISSNCAAKNGGLSVIEFTEDVDVIIPSGSRTYTGITSPIVAYRAPVCGVMNKPQITPETTGSGYGWSFRFSCLSGALRTANNVLNSIFNKGGENAASISSIGQEINADIASWPRSSIVTRTYSDYWQTSIYRTAYGFLVPEMMQYELTMNKAAADSLKKINIAVTGTVNAVVPVFVHSDFADSTIEHAALGQDVGNNTLFEAANGEKITPKKLFDGTSLITSTLIIATRYPMADTRDGLINCLKYAVIVNAPDDTVSTFPLTGMAVSAGSLSNKITEGSGQKGYYEVDVNRIGAEEPAKYSGNNILINYTAISNYASSVAIAVPDKLPTATGGLEPVKEGDTIYFYSIVNLGIQFPNREYEVKVSAEGSDTHDIVIGVLQGVPANFTDFGDGVWKDTVTTEEIPAFRIYNQSAQYSCMDYGSQEQ